MGIEAIFKNHIVMTQEYGYYVNGRWEKGYTPLAYTKGNIQPWKKGESFQASAESGLIFNDVLVVYIKNIPEFEIPAPSEAEDVSASVIHVWIPDTQKWYAVKQVQNWKRPGRGATHFKLFTSWTATPQGETRPPVPISQESVERYLNTVYELEQTTPLID